MPRILKRFLLLGLILSITGCGTTDNALNIGDTVSDFRLDTLTHERFYLNQHKDKVVVLVFWATWCRPCKTEMIELQSLTKRPEWKNVTVAAVCSDPENTIDAENIVRHLEITYPILMDYNSHLGNKFGVSAHPTTMIFDLRRRLSFVRVGYDSNMMAQINSKVVSLQSEDNKE